MFTQHRGRGALPARNKEITPSTRGAFYGSCRASPPDSTVKQVLVGSHFLYEQEEAKILLVPNHIAVKGGLRHTLLYLPQLTSPLYCPPFSLL